MIRPTDRLQLCVGSSSSIRSIKNRLFIATWKVATDSNTAQTTTFLQYRDEHFSRCCLVQWSSKIGSFVQFSSGEMEKKKSEEKNLHTIFTTTKIFSFFRVQFSVLETDLRDFRLRRLFVELSCCLFCTPFVGDVIFSYKKLEFLNSVSLLFSSVRSFLFLTHFYYIFHVKTQLWWNLSSAFS